MGDMKRIDDLIVLGRAAPEPISDGRETVCLGGYSRTEGWVRLYPTQRKMSELSRWNVVSVPVESDDSHDNRDESYKIAGSKKDWNKLHEKVEKVGELNKSQQIELSVELATDCSAELKKKKQSLGLVDPKNIIDTYLKPTEGDTIQANLQGGLRKGKNEYDNKLYIKYRCEGCIQKGPHDQHTIEWGVYRYWDKNDTPKEVISALDLDDKSVKNFFFVGNLNNRRTAYIIISVLRFKKSEMLEHGFSVDEQMTFGEFSNR